MSANNNLKVLRMLYTMLTKYLSFWDSPDALYVLSMVFKVAAIVVAVFILIFGWREAELRKRAKAEETAETKALMDSQRRRIERIKYGKGGGMGYDDV